MACIPFHFHSILNLRRDPRQGRPANPAMPDSPENKIEEASVKRTHLILFVALTFACSSPAFAQRHPGGGPPAGRGPSGASGSSNGEAKSDTVCHYNMSHASPCGVLSHYTAIAGKIKSLTGEDAQTACN